MEWLREKVCNWAGGVKTMSGVAHNHPQAAYAGLQKSLKQEWVFVQCATQRLGDDFRPVEKAL